MQSFHTGKKGFTADQVRDLILKRSWSSADELITELSKVDAYKDLDPRDLPRTECLRDTVARFLPYWHATIAPTIRAGKRVLIVAHGNSLRALVKYLDTVSDIEIVEQNIPTGVPLVYELDADLKPVTHYYLGDPEEIRKAQAAVAQQGKAKG